MLPDASQPSHKLRASPHHEEGDNYSSSDEEQLSVTTPFLRSQQQHQPSSPHMPEIQAQTHVQQIQQLQSPSFRFGQSVSDQTPPKNDLSRSPRPKLRLSTTYRPASAIATDLNDNNDPHNTTTTNSFTFSTFANALTSYLPTTSAADTSALPPLPPSASTAINIANTSTPSPPPPSLSSRRLPSPLVLVLSLTVVVLIVTDLTTGIISKLLNGTFNDIAKTGSDNLWPQYNASNSGTGTPSVISGQPSTTDGVPPPSLPADHPNSPMLHALRAQSIVTPRWPLQVDSDVSRLRTYGPAYASIIISHVLRVVYIPVFKVATTSMMYMIAYLEGNKPILDAMARRDGSHMALLHDMGSAAWKNHTVFNLDSEIFQQILDDPTYLKFGFVRNPYDRLISAYVDKIVRPDFNSYEYNAQLHSLYGDSGTMREKFGNGTTKPTFKQFIQAAHQVLKQPRVSSNDTTKREAYEDNSSRRDLHWRPQNELLHTDLIHVDFIGRYEQLQLDRSKVMRWMYQHTDRRFSSDNEKRLHASDPQLRTKLLKELQRDRNLKDLVSQMYADDFRRFHIPTDVPEVAEAELEMDESD